MILLRKSFLLSAVALFGVFSSICQSTKPSFALNHSPLFMQEEETGEPDDSDVTDYNGCLDLVFGDDVILETNNDNSCLSFNGLTTDDFGPVEFHCSLDLESLFFQNEYCCDVPGLPRWEYETFDFKVDDQGGLDTLIEFESPETNLVETHHLSEYKDLKELEKLIESVVGEESEESSEVSEYSLFGILCAVVVAIIVVYVVVAETAEQIRARENYEYNRELENESEGVKDTNYIYNQCADEENNKPVNYRFGFTTFDKVGCEVASVYNLLLSSGQGKPLSEVIYDFEIWGIEFSVAWGTFGSNPKEISCVLLRYGFSFSKFSCPGTGLVSPNGRYLSFKMWLSMYSSAELIVSKWSANPLQTGLHTFYISMPEDASFLTYNLENDYGTGTHASLDEIFNNQGYGFIVGYIINARY